MKIIGLTGGISSGKNFVAEIFAKKGAVIFDADLEVHNLLSSDKLTIEQVKKNFPESFVAKKIDRKILGKIVFSDTKKLQILEKIIHPKVRENYSEFLQKSKKEKKKLVVLNIPLLLETKAYKCDYVVAVVMTKKIQKERFIAREKKKNPQTKSVDLAKKFEKILSKQMSNEERKERADFVINNSFSKTKTIKQIEHFLGSI